MGFVGRGRARRQQRYNTTAGWGAERGWAITGARRPAGRGDILVEAVHGCVLS